MTESEFLRERAAKSRKLATQIGDDVTRKALIQLADEMDARAATLEAEQRVPPTAKASDLSAGLS